MERSNQTLIPNIKLRRRNHSAIQFLGTFAALLTLLSVVLLPSSASAQEDQSFPAAQVGNTTYATLQDAFDHVSMKNATVTLLADVSEQVTVPVTAAAGTITFDLNGHSLRVGENAPRSRPSPFRLEPH